MEAIIYRRFSSQEQGKGSTLKRQTELCEAYCKRKGWTVIDTVTDSGVSAWSGANIQTGNLAKLTKRLSAKGADTVIVVEQLDRITRQPPNIVINWLTGLTTAGSALATVNDDVLIDGDSFATNPAATVMLVFNAYRAFSESQHKSERLAKAWAGKRDTGKPMTARTVGWIKLVDGEFRVIEERAEIVRRIFKLALEGHGATRIAKQFNSERIAPFGRSNGWQISYIKKVLKNRAVLGEFQAHTKKRGEERKAVGDPIPDYYPQVVSDADFARVQAIRPTVRQAASRGFVNLLSGLTECHECGGRVIYLNGGIETLADGSKVRREYLQCEQARRGLCGAIERLNYQSLLKFVLDSFLREGLAATERAPDSKVTELEDSLAQIERQAGDKSAKADRLLTLVEEGDKSATERYRTYRDDAKALKADAGRVREALEAERASPALADQFAIVERLRADLEHSEEARKQAKFALDRCILKIICQMTVKRFRIEYDADVAGGDLRERNKTK